MGIPKTVDYYKKLIYERNVHYKNGIFEILDYINGKIITKDVFGVCAVKKDTLYKNGIPSVQSAVNKNEYAVNQFNKVHLHRYDYDKFTYIKSTDKSIVTCKVHGNFKINHHNHLQGKGCNKCKSDKIKEFPVGWSNTLWNESAKNSKYFDSFKVYIIKCWNEDEKFYKIGKTYNSVNRRFMGFCYNYKIVETYIYENAIECSKKEIELRNINKLNKYIPNKSFNGYSECFSKINIIKDK